VARFAAGPDVDQRGLEAATDMMQILAAATLIAAAATAAPPAPTQDAPPPISDRAVNPSEPDFTLIALPTTLRVPRFGSSFRVTHRFTRPMGSGSFSDLASDFFGFDGGAQVGLEFRFGVIAGTQLGIHRTSDRTIQLFLQHQLFRQGDRSPVTVDAIGTLEGTNNFRDRYMPGIGAVISRALGRRGAVYAQPIFVIDANAFPTSAVSEEHTLMIGLGARLRVRPSLYLVGEMAPRVGYDPGTLHYTFAIERRAGGHSFQINFSNGFGTTMSQLATGGRSDDLFIGFNISRKFF
jgi:hypothetical protein